MATDTYYQEGHTMKEAKHSVTHPDGTVSTRRSARTYTHAIVKHEADRYSAVAWSQSAANAAKAARKWAEVGSRNGYTVTVVECERTGGEAKRDERPAHYIEHADELDAFRRSFDSDTPAGGHVTIHAERDDERDDEPGVLHRHADGREHRHFSAGFEIGGQVRADDDGTDDHQHFSVSLGSGERSNESGPVVWTADAGELEHDDLEAAKAQAAELARRHVFVAVRETGCVDDGTRRYLVSAYSHHVKPAQYLDLRIVAWNTTAEIDR